MLIRFSSGDSIIGRKKLNLKTILIFCIIGLPLVFSQSANSQQGDVNSLNEKYVNDDYGYSIIPPKNWISSTLNDPSYDGEIPMFSQNDGYQGDFPPYFAILRYLDERVHYVPNYNIEKGKQLFIDGMTSQFLNSDEFLDYSITNTDVQEYQDGWYVFVDGNVLLDDGDKGTLANFAMIELILKSDEIYALVYYSPPEDYNKSFLQFVDSYKTFSYQMNLDKTKEDSFVEPKNDSTQLGENKLADFVDPTKEPTYYLNRYYNEPAYKQWFDKNYPGLTIEEAVGYDPDKSEFKAFADPRDVLPPNEPFSNLDNIDTLFLERPSLLVGSFLVKFLLYGIPSIIVFWLLARKFKWFSKKDSQTHHSFN